MNYTTTPLNFIINHMLRQRSTETTTNHETIRKWAELRGGHPARILRTPTQLRRENELHIDFGSAKETLEPLSWEDFFRTFEERRLAFLYQEKVDGKTSRFSTFVRREAVQQQNNDEDQENDNDDEDNEDENEGGIGEKSDDEEEEEE